MVKYHSVKTTSKNHADFNFCPIIFMLIYSESSRFVHEVSELTHLKKNILFTLNTFCWFQNYRKTRAQSQSEYLQYILT